MSDPADPSLTEEFSTLTEGVAAPPGPAAPPWGIIAALVLSGVGLVVGVALTLPSSPQSAPTGWPDPPRPAPETTVPATPVSLATRTCAGSGCAVQAKHPEWSLAACAAVAEERVAPGMTGAQVEAAWGKPERAEGDRWCYDVECKRFVRIEADRVVESQR